jgi:hypothetical protein
MTDSFFTRCAVRQGMSTWALSFRGRNTASQRLTAHATAH